MTYLGPTPPVGPQDGPDDERDKELRDLSGGTGGFVEHNENAIELKEVEGLSQGRIVFRRFLRHKGAMISIVVLALTVILAFSSIGIDALFIHTTGWWKWSYTGISPLVNGTQPTMSLLPHWLGGTGISFGDHPFGQDEVGHDIFARVMRGMQQSLMILVIVGIVSTIVGSVIGAVAGYFRGWIDTLLMRFTDMIIIIPLIVLAAIVAHTFQQAGSFVLALVLGLLVWTSLARLVRGEVLALREREFVDAAKVAGASSSRIIFRHILPNSVGVIIVSATLTMAAAILLETSLSYLGLGVHAPDVSLGSLIQEYQTSFSTRPWLFWWPGVFIIIIAITINFIGDGLRDAFDPRQKRLLNRKAKVASVAKREVASATKDGI
jgi:peptide/nickel transport system permease protein